MACCSRGGRTEWQAPRSLCNRIPLASAIAPASPHWSLRSGTSSGPQMPRRHSPNTTRALGVGCLQTRRRRQNTPSLCTWLKPQPSGAAWRVAWFPQAETSLPTSPVLPRTRARPSCAPWARRPSPSDLSGQASIAVATRVRGADLFHFPATLSASWVLV